MILKIKLGGYTIIRYRWFCIFVNPIKIYGERALRSDGSALFLYNHI